MTALVADAEAITSGNGYSTTVIKVYTESVSWNDAMCPAVALWEGTLETDEDRTTRGGQGCVQKYDFQLLVDEASPLTALRNFRDDFRNAVEDSAATILAVTNVKDVIVESMEPPLRTSTDISHNQMFVSGTLAVAYEYVKGSL